MSKVTVLAPEQGTVMASDTFWESGYCRKYESDAKLLHSLRSFSVSLYEYTGEEESPRWMRTTKG